MMYIKQNSLFSYTVEILTKIKSGIKWKNKTCNTNSKTNAEKMDQYDKKMQFGSIYVDL